MSKIKQDTKDTYNGIQLHSVLQYPYTVPIDCTPLQYRATVSTVSATVLLVSTVSIEPAYHVLLGLERCLRYPPYCFMDFPLETSRLEVPSPYHSSTNPLKKQKNLLLAVGLATLQPVSILYYGGTVVRSVLVHFTNSTISLSTDATAIPFPQSHSIIEISLIGARSIAIIMKTSEHVNVIAEYKHLNSWYIRSLFSACPVFAGVLFGGASGFWIPGSDDGLGLHGLEAGAITMSNSWPAWLMVLLLFMVIVIAISYTIYIYLTLKDILKNYSRVSKLRTSLLYSSLFELWFTMSTFYIPFTICLLLTTLFNVSSDWLGLYFTVINGVSPIVEATVSFAIIFVLRVFGGVIDPDGHPSVISQSCRQLRHRLQQGKQRN
ncbi:hypothetical protein GCK72_022775 [Caenorhabditis remanei]|uniref:Uncharacterized protein n=1 Tax=Caenorhabditis remanei TaxID=31234 RepID=A0A6A5FUU2_CAERE|nr:hypothetical protein GCK72_022775 [Caenorhabditis remanei]KAF1746322.1 hypothetical protein GCK72_022775 [Caenorhabditis remanei]